MADQVTKVIYEDDEMQVVHKSGSKHFRMACWSPWGTKWDGQHFWYRAFCSSQDIETIGFISKTANMYPREATLKAISLIKFEGRKPLISMGSCTGGNPAIAYSRALRADAVIAAVPMYSFDPELIPGDTRWHHMFRKSIHGGRKIEAEDFHGNIILMYDPYDTQSVYHIDLIKAAYKGRALRSLPVYNMGSQVIETIRRREVGYGLFKAAIQGGDLLPTYLKCRAAKKNTVSYCRVGTETLLRHNKPRTALAFLENVQARAKGRFTPAQKAACAMLAAEACAAAGARSSAIAHIEHAIELNGPRPHLLFQLGECFEAGGDHVQAIEAYQRLVDLHGKTTPALRAKQIIKKLRGETYIDPATIEDAPGTPANPYARTEELELPADDFEDVA